MTFCVDTDTQPVAVALPVGDTFLLVVTLTDADKQPVDLTGWSWEAPILDDTGATVATLDVIVLDPATDGVLEMTTDTDAIPLGDYTFYLRATDTDGDDKTLFDGILRIKAAGS